MKSKDFLNTDFHDCQDQDLIYLMLLISEWL